MLVRLAQKLTLPCMRGPQTHASFKRRTQWISDLSRRPATPPESDATSAAEGPQHSDGRGNGGDGEQAAVSPTVPPLVLHQVSLIERCAELKGARTDAQSLQALPLLIATCPNAHLRMTCHSYCAEGPPQTARNVPSWISIGGQREHSDAEVRTLCA